MRISTISFIYYRCKSMNSTRDSHLVSLRRFPTFSQRNGSTIADHLHRPTAGVSESEINETRCFTTNREKKETETKKKRRQKNISREREQRRDVNKRKPTSAIFHLKNHITIFRAFRMRATKHSLAQSSKSHSEIYINIGSCSSS